MAGAAGGVAAAIILNPLDILRTRLQSSRGTFAAPVPGLQANAAAAVRITKPTVLLSHIIKHEGFLALYRGLMSSILGIGPSRAIYFGSYRAAKNWLGDRVGFQGAPLHLSAAVMGGLFQNTVMSPWWVIRVRLQLQQTKVTSSWSEVWKNLQSGFRAALPGLGQPAGTMPSIAAEAVGGSRSSAGPSGVASSSMAADLARPYTGIRDAATRIYREEGFKAFYRGLGASYLGVIETGLQFALYGYCKEAAIQYRVRKGLAGQQGTNTAADLFPSHWAFFLSGASKLLASAATYPHEVIRTRMREGGASNEKYQRLLQTFRLVIKEEGWRALYGGLSVHLVRTVPNAAILLVVVEAIVGGEV